MESFFTLLDRHVQVTSSLLCIGLDPHPDDLPEPTAAAAVEYCLRLIKATARYAAAFKPNAAFFELYGPEGWACLKIVIEAVRAESNRIGSVIPVILDAKRGDIASTADAYAASTFEHLGAHAITLSPYLGHDSLAPFLKDRERGVFVLCRTSNPGSHDLQELVLADGRALFEAVADLADGWNTSNNIGLVIGATQPEALARIRARAPQAWFLAPGVGAQGGDLQAALTAGLRADGMGVLVPVSRAIARADNPGLAAAELRDAIETIRHGARRARSEERGATGEERGAKGEIAQLAQDLVESGCVKFGSFKLKSGLISPIYLDLRLLISHPAALRRAAKMYATVLKDLSFDRLAGLPYAALPIGTAVALEMDRPLIYPRREVKEYGTQAAIEGAYAAGETIAIIDDLATTGGTKIEAVEKLTAAGLIVRDIVVLVDRESGARETLMQAGFRLHAVATIRQLLPHWRRIGALTAEQEQAVLEFLK
ncbi:MAG: orotidine-5'-phosphate decarboxylase [Anaerolineales bacterium]|nr:orotidine-5'-phosphate decarboxylase [Anaerolineales bacterium]